jgi:uncharacterized membrane protein
MNRTRSPLVRFWHQVRVRPRLVVSAGFGALTYAALPVGLPPEVRALVTWDLGASLYLVLAWIMIGRATVEHMRWRARVQDDGARVVLILTVGAALASLGAILIALADVRVLPAERHALRFALVGVTFLTSWSLVHTAFALHYAHDYYAELGRDGAPALEFPRQEHPVYLDFMYFAMVIGMTSQTADVALASTRMRRLVMVHGLIAFLFNTTLLALMVNIAAGLIG